MGITTFIIKKLDKLWGVDVATIMKKKNKAIILILLENNGMIKINTISLKLKLFKNFLRYAAKTIIK